MPAAGYSYDGNRNFEGIYGLYWSSSLYSYDPDYAYSLSFHSGDIGVYYHGYRYYGFSVRAVCPSAKK